MKIYRSKHGNKILSGFSIIFSWLIDYTIDISIFICLIFIIKIIISKHLPAWWHYSLWLVLLIRMTIPWKYERNVEVSEIIPLPVNMDVLDSMILDKNDIVYGITTSASSKMIGFNIPFDEMLFFIWIAGALLFGIYYLVKNIKFWLAIKEKPMMIDKDILELLEECKKRMKINSAIGIIITNTVKSPTLFGYIRPRLLLPEGVLERLTHSELTYVFMPELGHEFNKPTPQQFRPVKSGDKVDKTRIFTRVTKEGEIWIENQQFDIDSMGSRMERFNIEYPEGNVIIVGDSDALLGTTIEVLDQVRMTGITNVVVALAKD